MSCQLRVCAAASLRAFPCCSDRYGVSLTAAGPLLKPAIYILISTTSRSASADGTSLITAQVEGQQRGFCVVSALLHALRRVHVRLLPSRCFLLDELRKDLDRQSDIELYLICQTGRTQ